jgi:hypothetical protein
MKEPPQDSGTPQPADQAARGRLRDALRMSGRRRLGVIVCAVAAISAMTAGAGALAASHAPHAPHARPASNYQGPARPKHAATIMHQTNYQGPARTSGRTVVRGSNVPAPVAAQRRSNTPKGSNK